MWDYRKVLKNKLIAGDIYTVKYIRKTNYIPFPHYIVDAEIDNKLLRFGLIILNEGTIVFEASFSSQFDEYLFDFHYNEHLINKEYIIISGAENKLFLIRLKDILA